SAVGRGSPPQAASNPSRADRARRLRKVELFIMDSRGQVAADADPVEFTLIPGGRCARWSGAFDWRRRQARPAAGHMNNAYNRPAPLVGRIGAHAPVADRR